MPISAIGNNARRDEGFTLVELMVVLVIIGIASATVVAVMPDPRGKLSDEAARLAARTLAVRDTAIVESRDTGVWISATGYGVEQRRHGRWQALDARPFAPVVWKHGTQPMLGAGGRVRAVFDTTGAPSAPMTFVLTRGAERASVTIAGDGAVRVGP